jgi:hypothetical protein
VDLHRALEVRSELREQPQLSGGRRAGLFRADDAEKSKAPIVEKTDPEALEQIVWRHEVGVKLGFDQFPLRIKLFCSMQHSRGHEHLFRHPGIDRRVPLIESAQNLRLVAVGGGNLVGVPENRRAVTKMLADRGGEILPMHRIERRGIGLLDHLYERVGRVHSSSRVDRITLGSLRVRQAYYWHDPSHDATLAMGGTTYPWRGPRQPPLAEHLWMRSLTTSASLGWRPTTAVGAPKRG